MNSKIIIRASLFLCLATILTFCKSTKTKPTTMLSGDYQTDWARVDTLEIQGLPQSALEIVEKIYTAAKRDGKPEQVLKTLIFKSKYISQREEDGFEKAISMLENELSGLPMAENAILHSMLGELYGQYLQQRGWQIRQRTPLASGETGDILTWTAADIENQAFQHYLKSVENENALLAVPISNYKEITLPGLGDTLTAPLRPTLFDFLAHRALDFAGNPANYLTEPEYKFELSQPVAFAPAAEFVAAKFETEDKTSRKFLAVQLFQRVLKTHLNDADISNLVVADLQRLKFSYQNSTLENKQELFKNALENLRKKAAAHPSDGGVNPDKNKFSQVHDLERGAGHPSEAEVVFELASLLVQTAEPDDPKKQLPAAAKICREAIAKYPKSFGAKQCETLLLQITRPDLSIQIENNLLPEQPGLTNVNFKNLKKIWAKVVAFDLRDANPENRYEPDFQKKLIQKLNEQPAAGLREWNFQTEEDFRSHRTEISFGGMPLGNYVLLVSENQQFNPENGRVCLADFTVTNISVLKFQNQGTENFIAAHRKTGQPMPGVHLEFFKNNWGSGRLNFDKIGEANTDQNGLAKFDFPKNEYYQIEIRASFDRDTAWVGSSTTGYSEDNSPGRREVKIFTDRAIYRPGQLVYFKGIALSFDKKNVPSIVKNEKLDFIFKDANYQEKGRITLTTNEFGTCNGVFTAPSGGLTGQMQIEVENLGSTSFSVEEYKRPKFEVVFEQPKESFKLGQKVKISGTAKNFAGSSVGDAAVKFVVNREAHFPFWGWGGWGFKSFFPRTNNRQIASGTIKTDADGRFEIEFLAEPDVAIDKKLKPNFGFSVTADVTDSNGETQTGSKTIEIGYVSLLVDLKLPDEIELDSLRNVPLKITNLAGEPQKVSGQILLTRLVEPGKIFQKRYWDEPEIWTIPEADFRRDFPNFAFKNEENPEKWGRQDFVNSINFETKNSGSEKSEIDLNLGKTQPGWYEMKLKTRDPFGEEIEIKKIFRVWDSKKPETKFQQPNFYLTKKTAQPGDAASFKVGSATGATYFFVLQNNLDNQLKTNWIEAKPTKDWPLKITENDKGNIGFEWFAVRENRLFSGSETLEIPWSEKELTLSFETFRDKLLPGQDETWRIKITGNKKEKVAAELVATMYDASLEQFRQHDVQRIFFPTFSNYSAQFQSDDIFGISQGQTHLFKNEEFGRGGERNFRALNWFEFYFGRRMYAMARQKNHNAPMDAQSEQLEMAAAPMADSNYAAGGNVASTDLKMDAGNILPSAPTPKPAPPALRKNLKETVFFFPDLRTDKDGNVVLNFKMNEALTRWKFLAFAHTTDLKTGILKREVVTQKDLMILANPPRFLREGDEVEFSAKISNLSGKEISGKAVLNLVDAVSEKAVNSDFSLSENAKTINFKVAAGRSEAIFWKLKVPAGKSEAILWQVSAAAGNFTDGEENALPVLPNRMLVTETIPLAVRGNQVKNFEFSSLADTKSSTRVAHRYSLEFTSNPVWYAVQALPYLMEFPHECNEQIFNRFYANALAQNITQKMPNIKRVFDRWKGDPNALKSNLSKNQELKSAILEETPWVLDAQNEEQQKQNIALLFDLNRMSAEREKTLAMLAARQNADGGWSWFPGSPSNEYITEYIVSGFGHLEKLGAVSIKNEQETSEMLQKALVFCEKSTQKRYAEIERLVQEGKAKWTDDHLGGFIFNFYARSFFEKHPTDKISTWVFEQAEKYWLGKGLYQEGLIALVLKRAGRAESATKITNSLRERALVKDELGMYWPNEWGYFWYQLPIETQSLMVEVFDEVTGDKTAVENLRIWLLKNKQTNRWASTKATAEAVTALLLHGENWLENTRPVKLSLGGKTVQPAEIEAGTGYFKNVWSGEAVKNDFAKIKVENPNSNIVWGAAYFQYFEDLDKIQVFQKTPLTILKQYFREESTPSGSKLTQISEATKLKPGDKLKVRIEIRVDRPMEFVHLKDLRPAGCEPTNVLSGYRYQDGLGYYESTKDLATNFFMDYLPRGTFVFEYPMVANLKGNFSTGITTMQCMYAPEFSSHSKGERISIE